MEGIDLAAVVDSDFHGIQINFAPPRPAGFANFRGAGRGKTCFIAGRGSPFSAGRGGAHIPAANPQKERDKKAPRTVACSGILGGQPKRP